MEQSFLTTFAYAKINLALAVLAIRDDGYHEIQSIMQTISLHDIVRVRRIGEEVVCRCGELSGPENLAYKAAVIFREKCNKSDGVEIEIEKFIPVQAGLAGGSSDAAAVLRSLNHLYGHPLDHQELLMLANRCGSDVAFCLKGGTMWAAGRGERLEQLPQAPEMDMVLIKPLKGVNTGRAYQIFEDIGHSGSLAKEDWENALIEGSIKRISELLYNDLEFASIQMVPEILNIKQHLLEASCQGVLMSGSGSSVFGIAKSEGHALEVARQMRTKDYQNVWVVKTVPDILAGT